MCRLVDVVVACLRLAQRPRPQFGQTPRVAPDPGPGPRGPRGPRGPQGPPLARRRCRYRCPRSGARSGGEGGSGPGRRRTSPGPPPGPPHSRLWTPPTPPASPSAAVTCCRCLPCSGAPPPPCPSPRRPGRRSRGGCTRGCTPTPSRCCWPTTPTSAPTCRSAPPRWGATSGRTRAALQSRRRHGPASSRSWRRSWTSCWAATVRAAAPSPCCWAAPATAPAPRPHPCRRGRRSAMSSATTSCARAPSSSCTPRWWCWAWTCRPSPVTTQSLLGRTDRRGRSPRPLTRRRRLSARRPRPRLATPRCRPRRCRPRRCRRCRRRAGRALSTTTTASTDSPRRRPSPWRRTTTAKLPRLEPLRPSARGRGRARARRGPPTTRCSPARSRAAASCTPSRRISRRTSGGTRARSRSRARGRAAAGASLGPTSSPATAAPTPASSRTSARSATSGSRARTTSPSTSRCTGGTAGCTTGGSPPRRGRWGLCPRGRGRAGGCERCERCERCSGPRPRSAPSTILSTCKTKVYIINFFYILCRIFLPDF